MSRSIPTRMLLTAAMRRLRHCLYDARRRLCAAIQGKKISSFKVIENVIVACFNHWQVSAASVKYHMLEIIYTDVTY
jgi:hypothetical protein